MARWQVEGAAGPPQRPPTAREHAAARRSMGGAALRIGLAAAREEMAREEEGSACAAGALQGSARGPRRVSVNPGALRVVRPVPPLPPAAPTFELQSLHLKPVTARSSSCLERQTSIPESGECHTSVGQRGWNPADMSWDVPAETSGMSGSFEWQQQAALSQLLTQRSKQGAGWSDRVERFQGLEAVVQLGSPQAAADMATNAGGFRVCEL